MASGEQDDFAWDTNERKLFVGRTYGEKIPGGGVITSNSADRFFAIRSGNLEKALQHIKSMQWTEDYDGEIINHWLLTEISSWNRDKEKIVILCTNSIIICKYDFVAMKLKMVQRIDLKKIKQVQCGGFEYPAHSVLTPRLYDGVRIFWGTLVMQPWYQKWNPLNNDIPFVTLTSHPLCTSENIDTPNLHEIKSFVSALKELVGNRPEVTVLEDEPIVIESYAGFISFVHNQSRLGYSRERGGVSF